MTTSNDGRSVTSIANSRRGGVKTLEGKEVSSMNARKHGILSTYLVDDFEKEQFEYYSNEFRVEFNVQSLAKELLLEQFVLCYIKLSRCSRMENLVVTQTLGNDDAFKIELFSDAEVILDEDIFKRLQTVLTRYEPMLVKRMITLIKELQR